MKLASYKDGSRDGQLVVVSRDLSQAHYASHSAHRLQQVLDDWNYLAPQLQDIYDALNNGRARHAFAFDPTQCMAPLPRAYQYLSAQAYPSHAAVLAQVQGVDAPAALRMDLCASDALLGPCDPIAGVIEAQGIDFSASLAVLTADLPQGCSAERALDGVRLLALVNEVHLRDVAAHEMLQGTPPLHSPCAQAFSPVVVTPDELGDAWSRGRVQLPLQCTWNGRKVGMCDAGADMDHAFGSLLAHACKTRGLRAGSIVAAGPISNKGLTKGAGDKAHAEWPHGYSCIAEKRAMEIVHDGKPGTDYLRYGDTIRMEMKGRDGVSVFGAIEQEVATPGAA